MAGLILPDYQTASFKGQSVMDGRLWTPWTQAHQGYSVLSGCAVTAKTPAAMKVSVASGAVLVNGTQVTVTAHATTTIAAATTHDRIDIVTVKSTGAITVVKGTACTVATWTATSAGTPPRRPTFTGKTALAGVYVKGGATSITSTAIVDMRVLETSYLTLGNTGTQTLAGPLSATKLVSTGGTATNPTGTPTTIKTALATGTHIWHNTTGFDCDVYLTLKLWSTAVGTTVLATVKLGKTTTSLHSIYSFSEQTNVVSKAIQVPMTVGVPNGWYLAVTLTNAVATAAIAFKS